MATVPEPNPTPAPPTPRWLTLVSTALKLAVLGLIGVAGWWLVSAYRDVLPGRTTAATGNAPEKVPEGESEDDWLLATGGWSLGDTPWQATRATVDSAELERKMKAVESATPNGPIHPLETEVIAWLKRSATSGPELDQRTEYKLIVNRTKFRGLVQSTPAGERLLLGQVAWPAGADWEFLELIPTAGGVGASEPLLPIPAGATAAARRWAGSNVVAELVGPIAPDTLPAEGWARAGWVRSASNAGAPVPSERFQRGESVREVWRFTAPAGQDYLLIFRPNSAARPEAR